MSKYKQLYTVKLRMAHYISYSLFDGPFYLDNRSNSRANTCIKAFGLYLLDWSQCGATRIQVIHNNFRIDFYRCIIQVSALSALDGRVLAYHGFNG